MANITKGSIKVTMSDGQEQIFTSVGVNAGLSPEEVVMKTDVDSELSDVSENPVQNKIIDGVLDDKADLIDGRVPSSQLPSYVDDVVEYASVNDFPQEGEVGKIYIALDTNLVYRWSGSEYIQIAGSTSVLTFASESNFPATGETGIIYIAEDTNKQFRWTGSAYVELSEAEGIYVIHINSLTRWNSYTIPDDEFAKIVANPQAVMIEIGTTNIVNYTFFSHDSGYYYYQHTFVIGNSVKTEKCYIKESTKVANYTNVVWEAGNKQDTLVSGSNIKTINNTSILGSGDVKLVSQSVVADEYDATATYDEGDYCMYNNALYQCISAISTAEAWDSTHWSIIQLADKLSSGNVLLTEVTYADLKAAVLAGTLIPGMQYRITDYVTVTANSSSQTIPQYITSRGKRFDLIVKAIDNSTLDHHASACIHPGETYFIASDRLDLWQIWYDIVPTTDSANAIYTWYNYTNGKGCIYRMIDQLGNDLPCDFKNILISNRSYLSWYQNGNWYDKTSGSVAAASNNKFYVGYVYNNPTRRLYLPNAYIQTDGYGSVVSNNVICCNVNAQAATWQSIIVRHLHFDNNFINLGYGNKELVITNTTYNKIFLGSNITSARVTNNDDANIFVDKIVSGSLQINDDLVAPAKYFAPNYDNTATYAVGDLVTYYGKLYVCNTAITTAESWTSAHWTETTISAQLSNYTAGTGIDITSGTISVDSSTVAMKSDLPTGTEEINFNDTTTTATDTTLNNIVVGNSTDGYTRYVAGGGTDLGYPAYDATATYRVGDIVIYDNKIYQCITAIGSGGEAWNSAHWNQVSTDVGDIVTITSTGVQSDAMAAKILKAKALMYSGRLYTMSLNSGSSINFRVALSSTVDTHQSRYIQYNLSNKYLSEGSSNNNYVSSIAGKYGEVYLNSSLEAAGSTTSPTLRLTGKLPYLDTAPTADNTSGFLTIVVLSAEPATRYNGYLYIITAAAA